MGSTNGGALLVGTRKGVFTVTGDASREKWTVSDPMFLGHIAQHVVLDPRDQRRIVLATRTGHLGPTVFHSDDFGATWTEATRPPAFRAGDRLQRSVQSVFWLTPGHADEPGVWAALATPKEALNDPQVKPNGYVVANIDDHGNEYQIVAAPVQFDEVPPSPARAPEHGQHTEEILLELDLDWDDISAAKDCGAIL